MTGRAARQFKMANMIAIEIVQLLCQVNFDILNL